MTGGLCLTALGGALLAALPGPSFTLSWTHSIEKTEWREEWRIEDGRLRPAEARIRGTGAGMEPGPEARRVVDESGAWLVWTPGLPPQDSVTLAASSFTADHRLCAGGDCRPLAAWTGLSGEPVVLRACP